MGLLWAEATIIPQGILNSFKVFSAISIIGKSESLPIIIKTFGFISLFLHTTSTITHTPGAPHYLNHHS
ncbi:MAG: hypothetical protein L0922_06910, partial [Candidatus Mariimomonas ferrooxydans]